MNTILFNIENNVGHIVLNQPPSNQMSVEFFRELWVLAEKLKEMDNLKALVISGSGRHFSSGANVEELLDLVRVPINNQSQSITLNNFLENNYRTFLFFENAQIPVISAIRGACLGAAMEFILFTHYRFCGEDAVFGLPETSFNLLPGIGGISRFSNLAGRAKAVEYVLHGNTFPAEKAFEMHLVDKIVPKKRVVQFALDFASSLMIDYRKGKEKLYIQRILKESE